MQFLFLALFAILFSPGLVSAQTPSAYCEPVCTGNNCVYTTQQEYFCHRCSDTYSYTYASYKSTSGDVSDTGSVVANSATYECNVLCGSKSQPCYLNQTGQCSAIQQDTLVLCGATPTVTPSFYRCTTNTGCSDIYLGLKPDFVNTTGPSCTGTRIAPWPEYPTDYTFTTSCTDTGLDYQYYCTGQNGTKKFVCQAPTATPIPTSIPSPAPTAICNKNSFDTNDFNIWLTNYDLYYGQAVGNCAAGDFNGDGRINGRDYVMWMKNYVNSGKNPTPSPTTDPGI